VRHLISTRHIGCGLWVGAMLAFLLMGCGSDPIPVSPLQPLKSSLPLSVKWKVSVGKALDNALVGGVLYVANEGGELSALDAKSGSNLWHVKTNEKFSAGVGSGNDLLLLGTKKGEVIAYSMKGELRWRSQLSSELSVPPQAADGVVVARTLDGHIVGLAAEDGKRRWLVTRPMPALVLRGAGGIVTSRGAAFVGQPGGRLLAIDMGTGNVGWEAAVSMPKGATELERVSDVLGNPLLGEADVCAASYQGKTACFDANKGALLWAHEIATVGGIATSGNKVYVADEKGAVTAFNRVSGTVAWKEESLQGRHLSAPGATEDYVVVGDIEGMVHFLSRVDGTVSGRIKTESEPITQQPLALGGNMILIQTRNGKLFALAP
jgi:outer membrane protein assembly factor BamB